jgi:cytochrome c-type protein NapC
MISPLLLEVLFIVLTILLVAVVAFKTELTRAPGGKMLAFLALFIFPAIASWSGTVHHVELSKQTSFCLSCHVMSDYGKSLHVDDKSYIPAAHFQNHLVPAKEACYTCHTNYTIYGSFHSKLRGLNHVYVQYLGNVPKPEDIKLYEPFNNRECLHCHLGARAFEEEGKHRKTPEMMADITSNKKSCTASNCHDTVHDVASLKDAKFWTPGQ